MVVAIENANTKSKPQVEGRRGPRVQEAASAFSPPNSIGGERGTECDNNSIGTHTGLRQVEVG